MSISVTGLTLKRPVATIQREFSYDSDGEAVGVTDNVSITDIVLGHEGATTIADTLVSFAKSYASTFTSLSYTSSSGQGRVTSLSFDSSSDHVNIVKYTITFKVVPTNVNLNTTWPFTAQDGVTDLSYRESIDIPTDINLISIAGNEYWDNYRTYSFEASVSCQSINTSSNSQDLATAAIKKIKAIVPDRIKKMQADVENGTNNTLTLSESSTEEGTASISLTVAIVPDGSSSGNIIMESHEESTEQYKSPTEYTKKTLKSTFRRLNNMFIHDQGGLLTESTLGAPVSLAQSVLTYYRQGGLPSPATPGIDVSCPTDLPKLPAGSCFNVITAGVDANYSEGTATAVIEATTEPQNCDGDGYKVEYRTNRITQKKLHAELFGWSVPKAIVQDLKSESADVVEYNVQVSSVSKCLTDDLKTKAEAKFEEIKDGSGTIIKHQITIVNGRCTVSATEFLGQPST